MVRAEHTNARIGHANVLPKPVGSITRAVYVAVNRAVNISNVFYKRAL